MSKELSKYEPSPRTREQIDRSFVYHAPKPDLGQVERYNAIRDKAKEFAELLVGCCPESRELSTALTRLEESVMHANASIARYER